MMFTAGAVQFRRMSKTLTVRLSQDLAQWLDQTARTMGVPRSRIVRMELDRARKSAKKPFLHLAGTIEGPRDLSTRKGFSRR
jgi:predicted transcriptional regulator